MLYMCSGDGKVKVVVLETGNIDEIKQGRPAVTPDKSVIIAWTPDPVWLADKIMDTGGNTKAIAALIDEGARRAQKPVERPKHGPQEVRFTAEGPKVVMGADLKEACRLLIEVADVMRQQEELEAATIVPQALKQRMVSFFDRVGLDTPEKAVEVLGLPS